MRPDRQERLDILTNTWTESAAGMMIDEYLKKPEGWKSDALFLAEVSRDGGVPDEASIKQAAFLLQCSLRRADFVARAGEDCFLLFVLGCRSREEGLSVMEAFGRNLEAETNLRLTAGGVLTGHNGGTYRDLAERRNVRLVRRRGRACRSVSGKTASFMENLMR